MTIGWEEVAKHTKAEMVGGDLIHLDPATNAHVKLGGKDANGQFTFTPEGQVYAEKLSAKSPVATRTPRVPRATVVAEPPTPPEEGEQGDDQGGPAEDEVQTDETENEERD